MMHRLPAIKGAHNLRDMGGYPTRDGRQTAWGRLFRSGALSQLDEEGFRQLGVLNIRSIFDFRANKERGPELPIPELENVHIVRFEEDASLGDVAARAERRAARSEDAGQYMALVYRALPFQHASIIAALCNRIAESAEPVLFHCKLGKDRTGVAAAVILDLVGVERSVVMEDYLLSNDCLDNTWRFIGGDKTFESLAEEERKRWEPVLSAHPSYLESALSEIDSRCGGMEDFARDVLGLEASTIDALRANLLE